MRYPRAIWRPTVKHGYGADDTHLNQGATIHSMEGSITGAFGRLDNPNEAASWTFSIPKVGMPFQHVDTSDIAWTNGSYNANKRYWGIECEGKAGEPLNDNQVNSLVDLLDWLWENHGLGENYTRRETLWEHNEMTAFGAAPTACPSGRIPWITLITRLKREETDMSSAEYTELKAEIEAIKARDKAQVEYIRFATDNPETAGYIYKVEGDTLVHVPNWPAFAAQADEQNPATVLIVHKNTPEWEAYRMFSAKFRTFPPTMLR